jgi:hypothetical protein
VVDELIGAAGAAELHIHVLGAALDHPEACQVLGIETAAGGIRQRGGRVPGAALRLELRLGFRPGTLLCGTLLVVGAVRGVAAPDLCPLLRRRIGTVEVRPALPLPCGGTALAPRRRLLLASGAALLAAPFGAESPVKPAFSCWCPVELFATLAMMRCSSTVSVSSRS